MNRIFRLIASQEMELPRKIPFISVHHWFLQSVFSTKDFVFKKKRQDKRRDVTEQDDGDELN